VSGQKDERENGIVRMAERNGPKIFTEKIDSDVLFELSMDFEKFDICLR